ncbi:TPA: ATP-binding protein [Burkholderia multivorans]|uniref:ATP-binding protein n=1 Tax=Burkholderia multivorans TaxID=87883 RepID=UPI0006A61F9F|nr:ATP-binding protein [Burkholderia multivorans]KOE22414.1 ATPase [Burkholderia multivorans R-20526]MBU9247733.1 ATP-binding protein [Burkholderia multivorans]MBU9318859.1 ATP-binding protein [Burkholderia multivorans]MCO7333874.1 ATP-binding protein [Burkholderia multivorans]MCO7342575.1 ATP-binding protein [Burkholderia multivorans]
MSILEYKDDEALGRVRSVDTSMVVVAVDDVERLRKLQVNRLAVLQSSRPGQHLVGIIQKITRTAIEASLDESQDEDGINELNVVRITLIGTLVDKLGVRENVFLRTLETVPEIDANCFALEGDRLTAFMRVIANIGSDDQKLSLGQYTLDDKAEAYLNGNKFFQRHATIVGSTGSGKSWTTARILEQVASLQNANAIVFDVHGEYEPLHGDGIRHFRIAGPSDLDTGSTLNDGVVFLPYWLLGYEAMTSMFVDRSDQNAPNQTMVMSRAVVEAKKKYLTDGGHEDILANFTIDSPIPFSLDAVVQELSDLNVQMVPGAKAGTEKAGDFNGKLSRLIQRLENKRTDRRLGFLFQGADETMDFGWLERLVVALLAGTRDQDDKKGGVKIIDFSEVPSDVLPLIVSLVAKLAFSVQQWTRPDRRHPVAIFCDEAHLYIPERHQAGGADDISVAIFERIAKEGRKYGVGLVVISQRPSEVNRTVLSQCNNLVAMRLTNGDDQSVVRRLLPDSLGGFGDLLPVLDTGEALVVGDASLLPTRIRVSEPGQRPNSGTVEFWERWSRNEEIGGLPDAVDGWRKQTMQDTPQE